MNLPIRGSWDYLQWGGLEGNIYCRWSVHVSRPSL